MIIEEAKPEKKRNPSRNAEAKLQASIVIDFAEKRPDDRGRLIGYFATTDSKQDGGIKNSLGLVKSVSDLFYIHRDGYVTGIEIKAIGEYHDRLHLIAQAKWLSSVPKVGYFCDSLEMFWRIINGGSGISPQSVLKYCLKSDKSKIKWNTELFNNI